MPQKKSDGRAGKAREADDSTLAQDPQKHLDILTSLGKFTGIVDRKGRLQFASEAPLKALGYAEEDILRKPFWEAEWFSPSRESQRTVKDSISGALGGKSVECHVQTFAKDGTSIPVTFNISPLKGPEGDIISIVAETEPLAEKEADTRKEHRPEASHERLDSLLTLLQEGYFETDTSDVLTAVSPSSAVILGYGSLDEMIGQRMANFWADPEERDRFLVELSRKGAVSGYRASFLKKNGTGVSVELCARLFEDLRGEMLGSQGTFRALDEPGSSKRALDTELDDVPREFAVLTEEETYEMSKARDRAQGYFRSLVENLPASIIVLDGKGAIEYQNESTQRMGGYEPEEVVSRGFHEFVHPDDLQKAASVWAEILSKPNEAVSVELCQRSKDGSWHNVEVTARNLLDNPLVGGIVVTHQDVTARREAEKALRQREQEYVSLIESSPDGVAVVKGAQFLFANRRAGEIFGLDPADFVGDKIPELMTGKLAELIAEMPEEERLRIMENTSRIAQGDQIGHQMYEVPLKRNTGQRAWIEINASPIQYKGEPVQLAFIRDVTKRKEDEQALRDREQKLQDALGKLRVSYEELSTPVVQVWDHIIALPLIGVLDTTRVQQVMDVMLEKIMETRAQVVILDVTGVVSVDTQVANHLIQAAQSVRLLGAECVITGIKPDVAHTMIALGIDMSRLDTKRDLHEALRYGLKVVGHDVAAGDGNLSQAPE